MFLRKCFLQWRPALLLQRRKTGKIFNFFLQFLGILGKCYARNSCLYLLDHKYEKKNSDVSSPLTECFNLAFLGCLVVCDITREECLPNRSVIDY